MVPLLWLASLALAQAGAPLRPHCVAIRIQEPPRIDGRLDEPVWQTAHPIGALTQVVPVEGAPPSERTEVRILYDADHLYLGIRCFDSNPEAIITTTRLRDAFLDSDDRVEILIDTFRDRRNAFFFQINAGGSKGDALITNNGRDFNKPWNGIWEGRSRVDGLGWSAEIALPFKTLSFRPGLTIWGFNISRYIGRRLESDRWSGARQDFGFFEAYHAGDLRGLEGIRQGIGIDVVPFLATGFEDDRVNNERDWSVEPGFDAFYKIIPSLTLALTVNTDFAETEVDQRQINLTRFPLFFPERRDFFLQDAGLFGFPSRGITAFFSRRIGLSEDGSEVPILAGLKLTGRAGPYNLGILDVQTDSAAGVDGENLLAARISRNVGERSTVGALITRGDPGGGSNTVVGMDASYSTSTFLGDKNLQATVWGLASQTAGPDGDGVSYGASIRYPNDLWRWRLGFSEIPADFEAALGFVRRKDIRRYSSELAYQPRPQDSVVRQFEFSVETDVFTDTADVLETWTTEFQPLGIEFESGEEARVEVEHVHDEVRESFEISDAVTVPAGDYDYTRGRLELESSTKRDLSVRVTLELGEFLDGDRTAYGLGFAWRPAPLFRGELSYTQNDVSLSGGDFRTQLALLRADFSFSPEVSWNNLLQWDNESDSLGLNARFSWIPVPGKEVFLVWNEGFQTRGSGVSPLFHGVSFKIGTTLRF